MLAKRSEGRAHLQRHFQMSLELFSFIHAIVCIIMKKLLVFMGCHQKFLKIPHTLCSISLACFTCIFLFGWLGLFGYTSCIFVRGPLPLIQKLRVRSRVRSPDQLTRLAFTGKGVFYWELEHSNNPPYTTVTSRPRREYLLVPFVEQAKRCWYVIKTSSDLAWKTSATFGKWSETFVWWPSDDLLANRNRWNLRNCPAAWRYELYFVVLKTIF